MRKLATIRTISDIQPIEGADAIEVATVDGWKVVTKKGEFEVGQAVIYIEIDSWVPHGLAPFLTRGNDTPREYNGVKGQRLRTVKLRGQVSQGLLLNYWDFPEVVKLFQKTRVITEEEAKSGRLAPFDVTEILGIQKWEAPIHAQMQGQVKGTFPTSLIRKTDQERIQNMFRDIEARSDSGYEITMKLDGSSCTIFRHEGELRVCSRNMEIKINDENADNTFVRMALQIGDRIPEGYAFQGELMGPGIQGNREGFKDHRFFLFDIFDIGEFSYLAPETRRNLAYVLDIEHVPVLHENGLRPNSVEDALKMVDKMKSMVNPIAEGVVFKSNDDPNFSFKVINTRYLLKGGE